MRQRLDEYLHSSGLFPSRAMAKAAVMEGRVSVEGRNSVKPGTQVTGSETISVSGTEDPYVSRGGRKLEGALDGFGIDVKGIDALDVGASTGGFTDCLLRRGAARVISVDVGRGQLHWKLRSDDRVTVIEGLNARYLEPGDLPFRPRLACVDVSFISLRKILPPVFGSIEQGGEALALVKPQFEAGREKVGKGGVVRDPDVHLEVLLDICRFLEGEEMTPTGVVVSPLKGPKGNLEFFLRVSRGGAVVSEEAIQRAVTGTGRRGDGVFTP